MCNCTKKPTPIIIQQTKDISTGKEIKAMHNQNGLPEPKSGDVARFCRKCYYKIVKVRSEKDDFIIEKYICSNPNCSLHSS